MGGGRQAAGREAKPPSRITGRLSSAPPNEATPPQSAPTTRTHTAEIIALQVAQNASPSSSSSKVTGVASVASHVFESNRANEPTVVSKLAANIAE